MGRSIASKPSFFNCGRNDPLHSQTIVTYPCQSGSVAVSKLSVIQVIIILNSSLEQNVPPLSNDESTSLIQHPASSIQGIEAEQGH